MGDEKSLARTRWNCKYHIVFAPKYRRQAFYGEKRRAVGSILRKLCEWKNIRILEAECCADHIHMLLDNTAKIQDYIKHQLEEDKMGEQLSLPYPGSPFTGRK
ncbi:hypothetical protein GE856_25215 [Salmonella enterica]|nr:hypothetical protein [Salmonella enterica]EEK4519685.1 IS200/IS605 family transposase [Salmonella enterica]EIP9519747.1 IS200/IS605 family transposase [Salmonella enterica]